MRTLRKIVRSVGGAGGLFVALVAIAVMAAPAGAGSVNCYSTKSATYCDNGTTFYQYGNRIQSNRGESWTRFGSHIYGRDGSWFADHGDTVTSSLPENPDPLSTRIVPERLFDDWDEED